MQDIKFKNPEYCSECGRKLKSFKFIFIELSYNIHTGQRNQEVHTLRACPECAGDAPSYERISQDYWKKYRTGWSNEIYEWNRKGHPKKLVLEE